MSAPSLFLDGWDILDSVTEIRAECARGEHARISFTSSDGDLYPLCDPARNPGTARLVLAVGGREMRFLLEERMGDERSFILWGRGLTALLDAPHAPETIHALGNRLASAAAVELAALAGLSLAWTAADWLLPPDWTHDGTPLSALLELAGSVGAVMEPGDGAALTVSPGWPVRPVDMPDATPEMSYDRDDLTDIVVEQIAGSGHDAVEVVGYSETVTMPLAVAVEEDTPGRGQTLHLRVTWPGGARPAGATVSCTDPRAAVLRLAAAVTEEVSETVVFASGQASCASPPSNVSRVSFIGDPSTGTVAVSADGMGLVLADQDGAVLDAEHVADVTYETTFERYEVRGHDVATLAITVVVAPSLPDVTVRVVVGQGQVEADPLSRPALTSEAAAVAAGTAWLDANRYDRQTVAATAPYRDAARPGVLAALVNEALGLSGIWLVTRTDVVLSGPRVVNHLEMVQCLV